MARSELEKEFLGDHRKMTRAFRDLIAAVEKNEVVEMREIANRLNRIAGPHIAFEEATLYPLVDHNTNENASADFLDEHDTARDAVVNLIKQTEPLNDTDKASILGQLQTGFDHAISCGSLLSHLTVASPEEQHAMLAQLQGLREQQCLWTDVGLEKSCEKSASHADCETADKP